MSKRDKRLPKNATSGLALADFFFEPIFRGENCVPVFYFHKGNILVLQNNQNSIVRLTYCISSYMEHFKRHEILRKKKHKQYPTLFWYLHFLSH
jgi:hypothetical protein